MTHSAHSELEAKRQALQATFDAEQPIAERNRLGQYATPPALAAQLVREALALLGPVPSISFLDPAFGLGVFWSALIAEDVLPHALRGTAFEIDPQLCSTALALWGSTALHLTHSDFTEAVPPRDPTARHNLLVCNPPYSRHHHLPSATKTRLAALVRSLLGVPVSGLSGLHAYFVLLSDPWLADGAVAAWLLPQEILHTGYAKALRQYLTHRVQLLRLHVFDHEATHFDDALVSSCLVFYRKSVPDPQAEVMVSFGPSVADPSHTLAVSTGALRALPKWHTLGDGSLHTAPSHNIPATPTVGHLFETRRGLATGANRFFILDRDRAAALGLPPEFLQPILPSPRCIPEDTIAADPDGYPVVSPQLVLLSCSLPRDEVAAHFPALDAYLTEGEQAGIHLGYLCKSREPWYRQEVRPPAPVLLTYMGRRNGTGDTLRFLRNASCATATNVYHLLYPKPALVRALLEDPSLMDTIIEALRAIQPATILRAGRAYGGGLIKIEPNELRDLPLILPAHMPPLVAPDRLGSQLVLPEADQQ